MSTKIAKIVVVVAGLLLTGLAGSVVAMGSMPGMVGKADPVLHLVARSVDDGVIVEIPRQGPPKGAWHAAGNVGNAMTPFGSGYIKRIYQLQG